MADPGFSAQSYLSTPPGEPLPIIDLALSELKAPGRQEVGISVDYCLAISVLKEVTLNPPDDLRKSEALGGILLPFDRLRSGQNQFSWMVGMAAFDALRDVLPKVSSQEDMRKVVEAFVEPLPEHWIDWNKCGGTATDFFRLLVNRVAELKFHELTLPALLISSNHERKNNFWPDLSMHLAPSSFFGAEKIDIADFGVSNRHPKWHRIKALEFLREGAPLSSDVQNILQRIWESKGQDPEILKSAISAATHNSRPAQHQIQSIAELLSSSDERIARAAVSALASLSDSGLPYLAVIVSHPSSSETGVRYALNAILSAPLDHKTLYESNIRAAILAKLVRAAPAIEELSVMYKIFGSMKCSYMAGDILGSHADFHLKHLEGELDEGQWRYSELALSFIVKALASGTHATAPRTLRKIAEAEISSALSEAAWAGVMKVSLDSSAQRDTQTKANKIIFSGSPPFTSQEWTRYQAQVRQQIDQNLAPLDVYIRGAQDWSYRLLSENSLLPDSPLLKDHRFLVVLDLALIGLSANESWTRSDSQDILNRISDSISPQLLNVFVFNLDDEGPPHTTRRFLSWLGANRPEKFDHLHQDLRKYISGERRRP